MSRIWVMKTAFRTDRFIVLEKTLKSRGFVQKDNERRPAYRRTVSGAYLCFRLPWSILNFPSSIPVRSVFHTCQRLVQLLFIVFGDQQSTVIIINRYYLPVVSYSVSVTFTFFIVIVPRCLFFLIKKLPSGPIRPNSKQTFEARASKRKPVYGGLKSAYLRLSIVQSLDRQRARVAVANAPFPLIFRSGTVGRSVLRSWARCNDSDVCCANVSRMESLYGLPYAVLEVPNLRLKRPSWLKKPSAMFMYAIVTISYFLVTGGEFYNNALRSSDFIDFFKYSSRNYIRRHHRAAQCRIYYRRKRTFQTGKHEG